MVVHFGITANGLFKVWYFVITPFSFDYVSQAYLRQKTVLRFSFYSICYLRFRFSSYSYTIIAPKNVDFYSKSPHHQFYFSFVPRFRFALSVHQDITANGLFKVWYFVITPYAFSYISQACLRQKTVLRFSFFHLLSSLASSRRILIRLRVANQRFLLKISSPLVLFQLCASLPLSLKCALGYNHKRNIKGVLLVITPFSFDYVSQACLIYN